MDFKLDMNVYDYKNELHQIYGSFRKLKNEQLCFIQDISILIDEDNRELLSWYNTTESTGYEIELKGATETDIEEHIKWCFDHYKIKYDYVKVKL